MAKKKPTRSSANAKASKPRGGKAPAKSSAKPSAKPAARKKAVRSGSAAGKIARGGNRRAGGKPAPGPRRRKQRAAVLTPEAMKPAPAGAMPGRVKGGSPETAIMAARLLRDSLCTDVVVIDVRGRSSLADYLVIGTGTSDRQMRSVADSVREMARSRGEPILSSNTDERTTWVVIDCVEMVVHLFEPTTRGYYDLESMYEDAPRIAWDDGKPAPSADAAAADADAARQRARERTMTRSE